MRPPFPRLIDSSMRADFVACPQSFFDAYILSLRGKGVAPHLHFGGCFARGLEVSRLSYWREGPARGDIKLALAAGAHAIIEAWGGEANDPLQGRSGDKKTLAACLDALLSYWIQYPPGQDGVRPYIDSSGRPAVEFSFALPIPGVTHPETGEPLLYGGRFDLLAQYLGGIYVLDDKTATALGDAWNNSFRLKSQMTGYVWGAESYGYKISGVLIRGIGIMKYDITHQMVIESRPRFMIERWLEQLKRDCRRMISCWEEGYWDYSLDSACSSYGGCPFLKLCTSANPENWIATDYQVVEPWDPLHGGTE